MTLTVLNVLRVYNQSHSITFINILIILFRSHIDSLDFIPIYIYTTVHITEIQLLGSGSCCSPVIFQPHQLHSVVTLLYQFEVACPCWHFFVVLVPHVGAHLCAIIMTILFCSPHIHLLSQLYHLSFTIFVDALLCVRQRVPILHELDYGRADCSTYRHQ